MTDERQAVVHRVAKMLNMTVDKGCTEQEALNAMQKAGELMAFYDIRMSEVQLKNTRAVKTSVPLSRYAQYILADTVAVQIAILCDCLIWREVIDDQDVHTFFGFKDDGEIAAYLQGIVIEAMIRAVEQYKLSPIYRRNSTNGRRLVISFFRGMEARLWERLVVMQREKKAHVDKETTGRSLVPMKEARIKSEADDLGYRYALRNSRSVNPDSRAYLAGHVAGNDVSLKEAVNEQRQPKIESL